VIALHNQNRHSTRVAVDAVVAVVATGQISTQTLGSGKNQSSGTKVIDRSDLLPSIAERVRGRCNCYAPSSESNQINNNRPQLQLQLQLREKQQQQETTATSTASATNRSN